MAEADRGSSTSEKAEILSPCGFNCSTLFHAWFSKLQLRWLTHTGRRCEVSAGGDEETAQLLRAQTALVEDPISVPSTHFRWLTTTVVLLQRNPAPSDLCRLRPRHTHMRTLKKNEKVKVNEPGIVVQAFNTKTQEAELGRSLSLRQAWSSIWEICLPLPLHWN